MVSVAPSTRISGLIKATPSSVRHRPAARARKKPEEAASSARWISRAPRWRATVLPAPMPIMKPMAWIMAMRLNTTPTAPAADVPSWDTKKVSAML